MDDLKIVVGVDLVRGKDAVFAVDFEKGDRDHQVAGELVGMGLCERKIVRHLRGSFGSGPIPLDGSSKGTAAGAITAATKSERPQLASGPFTG
ncbi:hypothetical protein [Rhizobium chutanense]|uniref:hypothetical protein n=1 Tax=Rhizobium chutanense TaxID=2035448 RepID=UPI0015CF6102|nr:hypothetical protein [Rhizobium chutanense]